MRGAYGLKNSARAIRDLCEMDSPALDPFATAGRFPYPRRAASTPGCEFCTKRRAYFEKQRGNHPKTRGFCTKRPECAQFNKKHGFRKETKVVMVTQSAYMFWTQMAGW